MSNLIAVRRDIRPNAIFFRQRGNFVEYSLDKESWTLAFTLPATRDRGGESVDLSPENLVDLINKYAKKYWRERDFNLLINVDVIPESRGDAIQNPPETAYNPLRLCVGIKAFLISMRAIGRGIQNGKIEIDDANSFLQGAVDLASSETERIYRDGYLGQMVAFAFHIAETYLKPLVLSALVSYGSWTDQDIDDYTCCLYDELNTGEFNYSEFVTAGETCNIGAWDEIAIPQIYAGFVNLVTYGKLNPEDCPCVDCLIYTPTDGNITRGVVSGDTLITQSYTVSGSLIRMGAVVEFTTPNILIQEIFVFTSILGYENTNDPVVPTVQFIAPGTGGGFTPLPAGIGWTKIDPAQYPQVPISTFTLNVQSSTCSACNTSQLASYNNSYGALMFVLVCGILQ